MRVIVRVGEERDRQDIGLQFRLPEIAGIAADTRQQAIIYPFCLQPLAVAQDIMRQFVRDRRSNPLWIIGEETATDLHQLTIGLREKAVAQHHLEARAASRDGSDRSEEHTSELQSLMRISYAVFCLKKKK